MICAVFKSPDISLGPYSLIELRLDYFKKINIKELRELRWKFPIPMIFTLRSREQGGVFEGSEEERLDQLKILATLRPEFIDLEYTVKQSFINEILEISPKTKIIISYHDFDKMSVPEKILKLMKEQSASIYKMAFMTHSAAEALYLLQFMREHHSSVVAIGMGPYGESTRILAPIFEGKFVYASSNKESSVAPGQLSVEELINTYHQNEQNTSTGIYGLIGDPVDKSPSHLTHNAVMHELKLNAVYVKFQVPSSELKTFIDLTKFSNFKGLSVTMPLKEAIIPLLDEIDPVAEKMGAVNTLVYKNGKIKGYNTDGKGALDALEAVQKVKGKKIVIIGFGGAAKAIIYEAKARGAEVIIVKRGQLPPEKYDIIINATPSEMPVDPKYILSNTVAMEVKLIKTEFLKIAKEKGCRLVLGRDFFINQAEEQFKLWFGNSTYNHLLGTKLAN